MVYISSDHGGFQLKQELIEAFKKENAELQDLGPFLLSPDDDYPDYVLETAKEILKDKENKGILICRNGIGVCIAANKISGIRAGTSWEIAHAKSARTDDNTNVLCLPADYIDSETAYKIVKTWINTPFSGEQKHKRRLKKIEEIEKTLK